MPPKRVPLIEDLIEALKDTTVTDALSKAVAPSVALSVDEMVKKSLVDILNSIKSLTADNSRLSGRLTLLEAENTTLKQRLDENEKITLATEAYLRMDNLIINGLPEQSFAERASPGADSDALSATETNNSVECTVLDFFRKDLNVDVSAEDISTAHRLRAGARDSVRPIIVRFVNRKTRNKVFSAKSQLKATGKRIFINEHLTKSNADIFYEARKMVREKRIYAAWTRNGLVNVRFSADQNQRPVIIHSKNDLTPRRP